MCTTMFAVPWPNFWTVKELLDALDRVSEIHFTSSPVRVIHLKATVKIGRTPLRHSIPQNGLFPSCQRGFWPGIYEGIRAASAFSQVGTFPYPPIPLDQRRSFPRPSSKGMGFDE